MIRQYLIIALTAAALLGGTWAAAASVPPHAVAAPRAATPRAAAPHAASPLSAAAMSPAALAAAADRCAAWASQAGFAANGYLAGALTTAVAVALAESGCDPAACHDETTGAACAAHVPAGHSVDRGAWQINGRNPGRAAIRCAFSGPCSARAAYTSFSLDGTYFARWSTYLTDAYAQFLAAAQASVNALRAGTVTGGLPGSCLGYPSDVLTAAAVLLDCGSGAADQQWTMVGSTLRTSGGLCLTAASAGQSGPAVLSACDNGPRQRWLAHADAALYNPAARRCLSYPGTAIMAGTVIGDAACDGTQGQAWFRP
jgi:hypothetical protein